MLHPHPFMDAGTVGRRISLYSTEDIIPIMTGLEFILVLLAPILTARSEDPPQEDREE